MTSPRFTTSAGEAAADPMAGDAELSIVSPEFGVPVIRVVFDVSPFDTSFVSRDMTVGVGGAATSDVSNQGGLVESATNAICETIAEGGTPVDIIASAAGGVAGYLIEHLTAKGASETMRRHYLRKPVPGSTVEPNDLRTARRLARGGLIGIAAGLAASIYFEEEIDKAVDTIKKSCQKLL